MTPTMRSSVRPRSDLGWLLGDWTPPLPPAPATETDALGLPPFGRGLDLIAGTIAGLVWRAMSWDADLGIWQRIAKQPNVLTDPNPMTTLWSYKWAAVEDLVLFGNHVALYPTPHIADPADPNDVSTIDDRTGRASMLVPVPADAVWVMVDPSTGAYWFTIGGEMFAPEDLLHVSSGNRSGEVMGRGVLAQYRDWLGGVVAAEDHAGAYFAGGALPPAVLTSNQIVTQDQADELKTAWRTMTSTREPIVLPTGYVLTPLVSNAEQAQLVEARTWNATVVGQLLGIPSWKLGLAGPSMTYQNVDQADIVWIQDTVDRWAQPLAAAFSKWLMPTGTDVRWDYGSRLRADTATTATVLSTLTKAGIVTTDEARAVLGRPPMDASIETGTTPNDVPELTPTEVA